MNPRVIAAISIVAILAAGWSLLHRERMDGLGPIRSFEEAIGQKLASAMKAEPPKGVILVIDRVHEKAAKEPSRVTGLRQALKKLGTPADAVAIEYVTRDPMDAQAGTPSFPLTTLFDFLTRHPGADTLIVWSDIPFPTAADRDEFKKRGVRIFTMPNNTGAAEKMVKAGAIAGALAPRTTIEPTAGGMPDVATRVEREYELILP